MKKLMVLCLTACAISLCAGSSSAGETPEGENLDQIIVTEKMEQPATPGAAINEEGQNEAVLQEILQVEEHDSKEPQEVAVVKIK